MEIRRLQPQEDRRAVSRIYEESWRFAYRGLVPQEYLDGLAPGRWATRLDAPGRTNLVAVEGGGYAGTASLGPSRFPAFAGYGEIFSLYLLPEYVGKGYGRALLQAALAELASQGFRDVFLWVLAENARSRRFYERNGLAPSGAEAEIDIGGQPLREVAYVCRLNGVGRVIQAGEEP